jgi:hypothetical protein
VEKAAGGALLAGSLPTIALARHLVSRLPDRLHAATFIALRILVAVTMVA